MRCFLPSLPLGQFRGFRQPAPPAGYNPVAECGGCAELRRDRVGVWAQSGGGSRVTSAFPVTSLTPPVHCVRSPLPLLTARPEEARLFWHHGRHRGDTRPGRRSPTPAAEPGGSSSTPSKSWRYATGLGKTHFPLERRPRGLPLHILGSKSRPAPRTRHREMNRLGPLCRDK